MTKVGYARVSTQDQSLDLQIDELKKVGCEKIFKEKTSGRAKERPELKKCLDYLKEGDILTVYKLDRLGRTTKQLLILVDELQERRIGFHAITNGINTTTAQGKFFFTIMAAFAEMEAELIKERTNAGLAAARARGRKGGRPKTDPKILAKALKLYHAKTHTIKEITDITGVSKAKLYQALREKELET